ncbi:bifunctional aminoglycoside phosphotransferase/ATP-binding protein [Nocardia cerradoensis]|uniref:bifunctional aminoglycoside phosphotransferase/ATP-binding protein n=1 Tax=Nocardia cerradoensis TaxID=85688 RepID=UPI0002FB636A|nr:AAA family ATPase [Nocardia cerradoensis]NKY42740.1 AAA family ATPase [Nocardia cerradoensis]
METNDPFAALAETHSAVVVLFGDRAYKIKKPVRTDFLDFSTRAAREAACLRELELNRRFAPDVYLGIGHLSDPARDADEPVLLMRRLPDAARLSRRLDDPVVARDILSVLVRDVTAWHDRAPTGAAIDRAATVAAVRERWESLLSGMTHPPIEPAAVRELTDRAMRYLDGRKALFDKRIATGRIVDGHGDLRADDIFVTDDGVRVIDCLDFDDELRHVDRLDDICFLAMDLERLGYPDLGRAVVEEYLEATGDPAPDSLYHHYIAYRAAVRAKVDCVRYGQGERRAAAGAVRHVEVALRHLAAGAVRLVLVGGLPGTGKSTIARRLATATGAILLSSDHIRAVARAEGVLDGATGEYDHGAYTPAARDHVYAVMCAEARTLLAAGRSVVLDASWIDETQRRRASRLAAETAADLIELCCSAPASVAAARIVARTGSESDATPTVAAAMAADRDPWPGAVVLDTTTPVDETTEAALRGYRRTSEREPS